MVFFSGEREDGVKTINDTDPLGDKLRDPNGIVEILSRSNEDVKVKPCGACKHFRVLCTTGDHPGTVRCYAFAPKDVDPRRLVAGIIAALKAGQPDTTRVPELTNLRESSIEAGR